MPDVFVQQLLGEVTRFGEGAPFEDHLTLAVARFRNVPVYS
jgi:hypothetical protein